MRIFISYIKDHKYWFFFLVILVFLLCFLFYLYHYDIEPLLYSFYLMVFFFLIFIGFDVYQYIQRHRQRVSIDSDTIVTALDLEDSTLAGQDYHRLLKQMDEARLDAINENEKQVKENLDYITMWTHQMKLPIAGMQLLLEEDSLDKEALCNQLLRIDQYTDMVLAYQRMHTPSTDYLFRTVDLDELIRKTIRYFSTEFIAKKIHLDFQPTSMQVLTDEKWLMFILQQILSNALKYTSQSGLIRISLNKQKELIIEDNGIGISGSDLVRVFEKGYTGMNGRVNQKASGIGLYLCKEICTKLNHDIRIESEPGSYTRVILSLDREPLMVE